jgi:nitrile hydratase beta subunit
VNGIHDMGGMHGFGPILREDDEPLFHHDWEARVLALALATPSLSNLDAGRHQMELIPPSEYLRMSYYERWFCILRDLLVQIGTLTAEEVATARPAANAPKQSPLLRPEAVSAALTTVGSYARPNTATGRFAPGDPVRARNINPTGHTRLPRYVRGRCGTIAACNGAFVYPDSHARGNGEDPQPLYTVKFHARDLWGEEASANDTIYLDLWEPYLEPR